MRKFIRFDKSDFERLAERDRWSAGDTANLIVNVRNDLCRGFDGHYWKRDAEMAFFDILSGTLLQWHIDANLIFYGPAGDLGAPLEKDGEFLCCYDEKTWVDPDNVFVMKKDILPLVEELDEKVAKRLKGLLGGKYWKEPRADVSEKDLVQILTKRLIGQEEKELRSLPSKDAIIKELNLIGVGTESGTSSLYEWIGEVYPS